MNSAFRNPRFRAVVVGGVLFAVTTLPACAQTTNGVELLVDDLIAPQGLTLDAGQRLFVGDGGHGAVFGWDAVGAMIMDVVGFQSPRSMIVASDGALLVADAAAGRVERVGRDGQRTTIADGLLSPCGLDLDAAGNLLVLHQHTDGGIYAGAISRIYSDGRREVVATGFLNATGMKLLPDDSLLVAAGGYSRRGKGPAIFGPGIFEVKRRGHVRRLYDLGSITPTGLTLSPQGTLFFGAPGVLPAEGSVFWNDGGRFQAFLTGLHDPSGLAANSNALFVADQTAGKVWRVAYDEAKTAADDTRSGNANSGLGEAGNESVAVSSADKSRASERGPLNEWGYRGTPDYSQIPFTPEGKPNAPGGVTSVIGRVLRTDDAPLRGVTVRWGRKATRTNSDGYYLLTDLASGYQYLLLDGRSANTPGVEYPISMLALDLERGANVLPYANYFPILDTAHTTKVDPSKETVHTTPLMPGLEIHIPKGAKITSIDGTPVKEITVTRVPYDKPLYPMNLVEDFGNHFTLQPGGSVCSKPIKVIYNNVSGYVAGTRVQLMAYDPPGHGGWFVYGTGRVTDDGKQVIPENGAGSTRFGCNVANRPVVTTSDNRGGNGGEPVDLATGTFKTTVTDLIVPGLMPLVLQRSYRNQDQNRYCFGIGARHNYDWQLYGIVTGPDAYIDFTTHTDTSYRFVLQTNDPYRVYVCTNDIRFAGAKILQLKSSTYYTLDGWNYFVVLKDGTKFDFDGQGHLRAIRDANENKTLIERDDGGFFHGATTITPVRRVTQPSGRYLAFDYDGNRQITRVTDSAGRSLSYTYDASNRLVTVTNVIGGATQYGYDASNNMTTVTLPNNTLFLQNLYDANNRVTNQWLADGGSFSFSYTIVTTIVWVASSSVSVPMGAVTARSYNSNGFTTNEVDHLGNTNVYVRGPRNEILKVTDPLGRTTSFVYDNAGNVTAVTNAQGKVTKFTYEPTLNRLTSFVDPLGRTNSLGYDSHGNLTSITNALGEVMRFAYNQAGLPISMTDPIANTYTFNYSASFDLTTITDPLGNQITRIADAAGRPVALRDAFGRMTRINYDPMNRVTSLIDPVNGSSGFGYDAVGNLTNVVDALGRVVGYGYDNMNRLTTRTDQIGKQEIYRYDKNGNVTNFVDRRGTAITLLYDALDHRTGLVYSATEKVRLLYDKVGRVTGIVDTVSGTTGLTYDSLDRLTQDFGNLGTVSYSYNDAGLRTNMTVASQNPVSYLYDAANRLTNVMQSGSSASIFYDDLGRRNRLVLPNGINVLYGYDAAGRLTNITYLAAVTNKLDYTYDEISNRTSQRPSSTGGAPILLGVYNLPGAVSTSSYSAANQQLVFGSYTIQYDANGNVTNIVSGTTTNRLQWSARNQLTNMLGAVSASFLYDGLGRRITRTVNGSTVKYVYDGLDAILEKDAAGIPTARYLRGLAIDEPWQRSALGFVGEAGVTNGLRGWWKFNEGSGTTAADSSGNGNTGTLQNGALWGSGVASNAVNLDGANDYVSVGDNATLEDNATWTFAAWINPDTFNSTRDTWLFYKQNVLQWGMLSGASRQMSVNIGGGNNNSLQGAVTNSTQLNSNAWTHVAVTYTNSQVKFYVNGLLTDTIGKTYTMGSNNKAFSISTATESFDGRLDDMRYYNRALSDSELAGVYGEQSTNAIYLADALGSIVALTDTGKVIQTEYDYEPFGKSTISGSASASPYSFTAREDDGTGLYYYRLRYYHPALGRFTEEDPLDFLGQDVNLYVYGYSDPLRFRDPYGLFGGVDDVVAASVGAIAGVGGRVISDLVAGEWSSPEDYIGAFVGGGVNGWVSLYATPIAGGAAGAFVENWTSQWLKTKTGQRQCIIWNEVYMETAIGAAYGHFQARIPGATAGRGSWGSVKDGVLTKLGNSQIAGFSEKTALKMIGADLVGDSAGSIAEGVRDRAGLSPK